jgi:hypothetical protein
MLDSQQVEGSVISAGPTATSYLVNCASGTPSDECGIPQGGFEVLYGPLTWNYEMSTPDVLVSPPPGETSKDANHRISSTMRADCKLEPDNDVASCSGGVVSEGSTSSATEPLTGYKDFLMPVTITGGLEKLAAATASTTSTGGVPRITQNALVLGAAALVGGAMLA